VSKAAAETFKELRMKSIVSTAPIASACRRFVDEA
jgi:hypothetical protein